MSVKTKPTNAELVAYVISEELNIMEVFNKDYTDVEQNEVDAETFLMENYDYVVLLYNNNK